jgi:diguanylate cyclase (GGDEF)-like protein/PAS domain S-box-containing protein
MWGGLLVYRWSDVPKLLGVALCYALLARFMLGLLVVDSAVSIIWPSSGLALAALLIGGRKYWLAVFIGALVGSIMHGTPVGSSIVVAGGNALEVIAALWVLSRYDHFDPDLTHINDFVMLGLAAALGAFACALVGVGMLALSGLVSPQQFALNLVHWWQGDTLGIIMVTPLILVWRRLPQGWFARERVVETVACFGLAFMAGQIVFLGWFHEVFGETARGYWMFPIVVWSAARYGRHGVLIILSMIAVQMLSGTLLHATGFAARLVPTGLLNFWLYMLVLTTVGMTLALIMASRRQAVTSLEQAHDLLTKLSKHLHGVIYQFRLFPDGRSSFPYASDAMKEMYEVTPEQVREDAADVFAVLHPDDYDGIVESIRESARTMDTWHYEFRAVLPKQGVRWRSGESQPELLPDGSVLWHGYITDITDQKLAEQKMQRLTLMYKALSEISKAIVRMEQQEELFPLVCRCAVEFGGMTMAWVGRLDENSGHIVPAARFGSGLGYLDETLFSTRTDIPEGRGPSGTAIRENRTVIVNDFNDESTLIFRERAAKHGLYSGASFPIQRNGRPFAMLTVYQAQTNAFDSEVIELLEDMATDIAFALNNFDREAARQAAEASLSLAASVYETSSEAMTVTDTSGIILTVNPAFTKITGYLPEDVIGQNSSMLGSGRHDKAFYQDMWHEISTTGHWQGEIWDKRKNGEEYVIWLTINTIFNEDGAAHRRVSLFSDVTEWKKTQELIWQQANFDTLTGLPNRQMLHDRMEQEVKKSHRSNLPMALMFIDLDHFKEINDTLGHDMGDVLLKEAAERLTGCVRETDTVSRLGGDEFTVILSEVTEPNIVDRIAQNILKKLAEPFQLRSEVAYVSGSIGITMYPEDATTVDELLKNADQAMYEAKNQGRNRHHYFTPAMQQAAQTRLRLLNDLRKALAGEQFRVYYQPIVDLQSGEIRKAEALIRWQHPDLGLIGPVQFIPLAEETGLIIDIGEWVFQQAAAQAGKWRQLHHPEFQISVNKSPVQFHNEDSNRPSWIFHLNKHKLPGQCIVVEITEGLLLDTSSVVTDRLLEFRDAGIEVSLDDFGTGYSSLSYLNKFDIDYLKIDQSFVRDLAVGSHNMALCEAIIVMAHKLGMKVIAEGIEIAQHRDLLIAAGCDFGQGYLFSKPVPADQFEEMLKSAGAGKAKKSAAAGGRSKN